MLIRTPDLITAGWLAEVLGRRLELLDRARIGTGQMSQSHRVRFRDPAGGGAEESVVVKLASDDTTSRATGVGMGAYAREVRFYRELADRLRGPLAGCHLATYDEADGWFTLVLEDVVDGAQGDQVTGCTAPEARQAVEAMAALHAPVLGDLGLAVEGWLNPDSPLTQALHAALLPGFLERYADRLDPAHVEVAERFVLSHDAWVADRRPPLGLVHGDFRLDNLLFSPGGVTVVDWQTVGWGPAVTDLSYFLGTSLTTEERRAHERSLVRAYHEALLARGVDALSWETCWEEYRRQTFLGLLMATIPPMVVERTERGDDMFMAVFARVCAQVLDLDALDLLPRPGGGSAQPALVPDAQDEGRHTPGPEPLWNESWYFDAVSADGSLGVYARLGRLPNQGIALYTACVCGPERPTVMLVDAAAPLPAPDDDVQRLETDRYAAEQRCEVPLERWRVVLRGTGAAHDDPADLLREGEEGQPVEVELDLVWETDGAPYRWRIGARYEVPCRVRGTVRVGDDTFELDGPGQRDHSWGARDWWATDWMWSAFHLGEGTHTHMVTTPQFPGRGVGYCQEGGAVTELGEAGSALVERPDGLVAGDRLDHGAAGPALDVEPLAYGPILLLAPDGRRSHFVRAMARVRAGDGREGLGWIEWNRVQQAAPATA
ncbi:phosphotransferase family protein [Conexibacter sp. SYSU D00693]|uniref:phosphotransferase family protein n=1 Tax=Conexibacter sp. SYSU D00693 TaxID=2812560 RepID=UPI00196A9390|nr:phosphotransferase [Conexibacter sp. SYSU D00693]